MSPITHFLAGWVLLERRQACLRDKALVALAGVAPDLDGLGLVVDAATRLLGMPETNYYQAFHRVYGHGLPAALLIAVLAGALGTRRWQTACWAFVSVHLHLLCDLLGSRGTTSADLWGIWYLAPFSTRHGLVWTGQWPLVGWQNIALTAVLIVLAMERATRVGYSPVALVSARGDEAFIATLRYRKRWLLGLLGRDA